jgi:DNA-3-methyladenine glycosylase II
MAKTNTRGELHTFEIRPKPPFRLDLTVWVLRRSPLNEMDRWDGTTYRRVLPVDRGAVELAVRQLSRPQHPRLAVDLACGHKSQAMTTSSLCEMEVDEVRRVLTRLLGLDIDLRPFYGLMSTDKRFGPLAHEFMGAKPPRFPSVFEGVVNGIACQQLSLNVGITLLNRLCKAYGRPCGDAYAFPRPEDLADVDPRPLRSIGFSTQKAKNTISIARAIASAEIDLENMDGVDDTAAEKTLDGLKGVGRWTAQYVALRGLGRLDVFPADDVGSQNKIRQWLSWGHRPNYEETTRLLAGFRPYRGLIYFHLLLNYLAEQGLVTPSEERRMP